MRLSDDYDDENTGFPVIYIIFGVVAFILIILMVVLFNNQSGKSSNPVTIAQTAQTAQTIQTEQDSESVGADNGEAVMSFEQSNSRIERLYREHKLTADDLDFWDMFPQEEPVVDEQTPVEPEHLIESSPSPTPQDPSTDGKHTLVEYADGTEEWLTINSYLDASTYQLTQFKLVKDRMEYYEGQKKTSYFGVDLSKYNGTVDFAALKEDGVDFVMLRLGSRGYSSGTISLDEKFQEYLTAANLADIKTGVYFFSQAITVDEVIEEANFVIQNLEKTAISYPVVFDMEHISNDTARIDGLTKAEKTQIADAFLQTVQNAGYIPMLYGDKEWLLTQIDLTGLTGYDIWLSQIGDLPDYPYQYQMWQYSLKGTVDGITGNVDYNISFVDYAAR